MSSCVRLSRPLRIVLDRAGALDAVYTHFATADDPEHPLFGEQRERFDRAVARLSELGIRPRARHAANSAALLRGRARLDAVRPGLALFGIAPRVAGEPLTMTLAYRYQVAGESRNANQAVS